LEHIAQGFPSKTETMTILKERMLLRKFRNAFLTENVVCKRPAGSTCTQEHSSKIALILSEYAIF